MADKRTIIIEGQNAVQIDFLDHDIVVAVGIMPDGEVTILAMRSHGESSSSWDNAEFETSWGKP
jgi:hypothetical protein